MEKAGQQLRAIEHAEFDYAVRACLCFIAVCLSTVVPLRGSCSTSYIVARCCVLVLCGDFEALCMFNLLCLLRRPFAFVVCLLSVRFALRAILSRAALSIAHGLKICYILRASGAGSPR